MVHGILDNDLYKFTMMQAVFHQFPYAQARYKFVMRSKDINLTDCMDRIKERIHLFTHSRFDSSQLKYISDLPFIKPDFVDHLSTLNLDMTGVKLNCSDGNLELDIRDSWLKKILFEVPLMSIISEAYLEDKTSWDKVEEHGLEQLERKVQLIKNSKTKINLIDFGTRRRFSLKWHNRVLEYLTEQIPESLVGSSNLHFARKFNLTPVGTMAHEWLMAGQALTRAQDSQKYMLEKWMEEYRGQLGIALTDTIGMNPFLNDFDLLLSKVYDGCRHDSADPFKWGDTLISHYEKLGIDPKTKKAVFSDGLNFEKMIELAEYFEGRIQTSFGIGTNLTNDVGVKPLSMVIKLVELNGCPLAKISDEPIKAICEDPLFLQYLKKVYGV